MPIKKTIIAKWKLGYKHIQAESPAFSPGKKEGPFDEWGIDPEFNVFDVRKVGNVIIKPMPVLAIRYEKKKKKRFLMQPQQQQK